MVRINRQENDFDCIPLHPFIKTDMIVKTQAGLINSLRAHGVLSPSNVAPDLNNTYKMCAIFGISGN